LKLIKIKHRCDTFLDCRRAINNAHIVVTIYVTLDTLLPRLEDT